jgi:tetratricopeptide (TPR) repeat protein
MRETPGFHRSRRIAFTLLGWGVLLLFSPSLIADDLADAQALFYSGKYAACIRAAAKGIEDSSWDESWRHLKIEAELETGRYADALATLEAALQRFPASIRLRLLGHRVCLFNNRPQRAQNMLDEIEALVSGQRWRYRDSVNAVALGRFLLLRGADARLVLETFYDRVKSEQPDYVETYLATGELALQKHDYAVAAEAFRQAVKLRPADPAGYYGLALSFGRSEPDEAHKALARALELNPHHPGSLLVQVDQLIDAEQYEQAQGVLDQVFAVNPRHPEAWAYRAVLASLEGDALAEGLWRSVALRNWRTNPAVDHLIGRKLSQEYRFSEGAAYQRLALKLDPEYLPAKLALSQDLLRLGQEEEGWRLADEVYREDAYSVVAHNLVTLRETLEKFKTLKADGLLLRMQAREADIYGDRALELLQRAKRELCAKYEVELQQPIVVEIFPEQKDFAVRTFGMPGSGGFLGVCFGSVITANSPASQGASPSNWQAVLWHEFCHVVTLRKTHNKMPRWLSEGISVYEEKQAQPSWGQSISARYRKMILEGEMIPVSRLSGAFLNPPSPLHLQFAYYESSLAVEYLFERYGPEAVKRILVDLSLGQPIEAVLKRHVGSLERLDDELTKFARQRAEQFGPDADWEPLDLPVQGGLSVLIDWNREHPNNVAGLHLMAKTFLEQQAWQEAKEPLEKLLKLCPEDIGPDNAYLSLARAHRELGETEAERAVLDNLAARDASAVGVCLRLMELCRAAEDWEGLARAAERVLAVNPLLRAPHRDLARAAEAIKDRSRAISSYRALLRMDPQDPPETHFRLGRLLQQEGHLQAARRHVLRALEEAPRFRAAQRALLEIIDQTGCPPASPAVTPPAAEHQP